MSTPPSLSPNIPYPLLANSSSDTDSDTDSDISGLRHVNYCDLEIPSLLRTTQQTAEMSLNDSFDSNVVAFDINDPFPKWRQWSNHHQRPFPFNGVITFSNEYMAAAIQFYMHQSLCKLDEAPCIPWSKTATPAGTRCIPNYWCIS